MQQNLSPAILASVCSLMEAQLVLDTRVDIIDLKDPNNGALGALPLPLVQEIVNLVAGKSTISATIGDLPMIGSVLVNAIAEIAKMGVDIIKVGFFGQMNHDECIQELAPIADSGTKLVAVLFVDQGYSLDVLPLLREACFYGVMLDTNIKDGKGLLHYVDDKALEAFVDETRCLGLQVGLAGSLKFNDIERVVYIRPNYLGFRSALCLQNHRKNSIHPSCLQKIVRQVRACSAQILSSSSSDEYGCYINETAQYYLL